MDMIKSWRYIKRPRYLDTGLCEYMKIGGSIWSSSPFNHPLMAGSKLRYTVWSRTSPSLRSESLGASFVSKLNVSSGMILSLGRLFRWTDVYVEADIFIFDGSIFEYLVSSVDLV